MVPAVSPCALCAEQLVLTGLPYRIVLRCTHSES